MTKTQEKKNLPSFTPEELSTLDPKGRPLVHNLIRYSKQFFTDFEILSITDRTGWSAAHEMADMGYMFASRRILTLSDDNGTTVAHVMVKRGYKFESDFINDLEDLSNLKVKHVVPEQKVQAKPLLDG